jgi:hypothetical protein
MTSLAFWTQVSANVFNLAAVPKVGSEKKADNYLKLVTARNALV